MSCQLILLTTYDLSSYGNKFGLLKIIELNDKQIGFAN
jgi:hypothetical protein